MKNKRYTINILAIAMIFFSNPSWAHVIDIDTNSILSGFIHPLTGFDHLFTLFALGLLSLRQQPKDGYLLIILFLSGMGLGFALSKIMGSLLFMEELIGLSVVTLGVMFLFRRNLGNPAALAMIALFAIAHGYVHGIEVRGNSAQVLAGLFASSSLIILIPMVVFRQGFLRKKQMSNGIGFY